VIAEHGNAAEVGVLTWDNQLIGGIPCMGKSGLVAGAAVTDTEEAM
jgi:hypothetical protein